MFTLRRLSHVYHGRHITSLLRRPKSSLSSSHIHHTIIPLSHSIIVIIITHTSHYHTSITLNHRHHHTYITLSYLYHTQSSSSPSHIHHTIIPLSHSIKTLCDCLSPTTPISPNSPPNLQLNQLLYRPPLPVFKFYHHHSTTPECNISDRRASLADRLGRHRAGPRCIASDPGRYCQNHRGRRAEFREWLCATPDSKRGRGFISERRIR